MRKRTTETTNTSETTASRALHSIWILIIGTILSLFFIAVAIKELANGYHFDIEGMRVEVGGRTGIHFMMLPGLFGVIFGLTFMSTIHVAKKRNTRRTGKRSLKRDRKIFNIVMIAVIVIGFGLFITSFNQDYNVKIYNGTATVGDDISYVKTTLNALYSEDELSSYLRGWSIDIDSPSDIRRIIDRSKFGS